MAHNLVENINIVKTTLKKQWGNTYRLAYEYILKGDYICAEYTINCLNTIYNLSVHIMPYEFNTVILTTLCTIREDLRSLKRETVNKKYDPVYQSVKYTDGTIEKVILRKGRIINIKYDFGYIEIEYRTPNFEVKTLRMPKLRDFKLIVE